MQSACIIISDLVLAARVLVNVAHRGRIMAPRLQGAPIVINLSQYGRITMWHCCILDSNSLCSLQFAIGSLMDDYLGKCQPQLTKGIRSCYTIPYLMCYRRHCFFMLDLYCHRFTFSRYYIHPPSILNKCYLACGIGGL